MKREFMALVLTDHKDQPYILVQRYIDVRPSDAYLYSPTPEDAVQRAVAQRRAYLLSELSDLTRKIDQLVEAVASLDSLEIRDEYDRPIPKEDPYA